MSAPNQKTNKNTEGNARMNKKTKPTSRLAHAQNIAGRVYQPLQAKILSALKRARKPLTRAEISLLTGIAINSVTPRVCDLMESGSLKVTGIRKCSTSGRSAEAVFIA